MSLNEPSFGCSALVPFPARTHLAKVAERYLLVYIFPVKIFGSSLHSGEVFISGSQIYLSLPYNVESSCLLLILNLEVRFLLQCMPCLFAYMFLSAPFESSNLYIPSGFIQPLVSPLGPLQWLSFTQASYSRNTPHICSV